MSQVRMYHPFLPPSRTLQNSTEKRQKHKERKKVTIWLHLRALSKHVMSFIFTSRSFSKLNIKTSLLCSSKLPSCCNVSVQRPGDSEGSRSAQRSRILSASNLLRSRWSSMKNCHCDVRLNYFNLAIKCPNWGKLLKIPYDITAGSQTLSVLFLRSELFTPTA